MDTLNRLGLKNVSKHHQDRKEAGETAWRFRALVALAADPVPCPAPSQPSARGPDTSSCGRCARTQMVPWRTCGRNKSRWKTSRVIDKNSANPLYFGQKRRRLSARGFGRPWHAERVGQSPAPRSPTRERVAKWRPTSQNPPPSSGSRVAGSRRVTGRVQAVGRHGCPGVRQGQRSRRGSGGRRSRNSGSPDSGAVRGRG